MICMLLMSLIDDGGVLAIVSASQWMLFCDKCSSRTCHQALWPLPMGTACVEALISIITVIMTLVRELQRCWLSDLWVVQCAVGAKLHVDDTPQAYSASHMEHNDKPLFYLWW
jgi:hypothetical protein